MAVVIVETGRYGVPDRVSGADAWFEIFIEDLLPTNTRRPYRPLVIYNEEVWLDSTLD